MKKIICFVVICLAAISNLPAQPSSDTYFTMDQMPDLVRCLPAPPDTSSVAFKVDVERYEWGKQMRLDPERAAQALRDAYWDLDSLAAIFSEPFGMKISSKDTPEIYKALTQGILTIQQMRVRPKAHFHRKRPFEYFGEHIMNPWEEKELRGEGSYPSGHSIRGWAAALILCEINPDAANELFARGWSYGESRVISGAHWQSDVDISRQAAAIGYSFLQTSPAFRKQMDRARREFKRRR